MALSAKRAIKQFVGHPEEHVPVVSTRDWTKNLSKDPLNDVGHIPSPPIYPYSLIQQQAIGYVTSLFPIFSWIGRYSETCQARSALPSLTHVPMQTSGGQAVISLPESQLGSFSSHKVCRMPRSVSVFGLPERSSTHFDPRLLPCPPNMVFIHRLSGSSYTA